MKKILNIILLSLLIILAIGLNSKASANSINNIDMDIYVSNNGNAEVTEKWSCNSTGETEWYRSYFHLDKSVVSNLRVSDNTRTYTTLSSWDVSGSFSDKAYKCGLNKINDGVEICWGKSSYGSNLYTVKYDISNFVSELSDCQMMYWTLIPSEHFASMGTIKIKIHADVPFKDTIDVWGYGNYGGLCYVSDGAIHMQTSGTLKKSEYMTILAKFPKETFNASNVLKHDFNYYFEMAEDGSKKYNKKKESFFEKFGAIIAGIFTFIVRFLPLIIVAISAKFAKGNKYGFNFGKEGKKIPKDVPYYRDIPCNGDIFKAYYIAYQYGLVKNKTDILGAIILKWLKAGIIRTEQRQGGKVFKKEDTVIILSTNETAKIDNAKEAELHHMMYVASKDGILENREFEVWCKNSYDRILKWFDNILDEQRTALAADGLIKVENGGFMGRKYTATPEIKEEALKIAGLKRFLLEYTLIQERFAIEVELFEDYLIFAQMLGIAKQVSKQFKEIYPDLIERTNYGTYDNVIYINHCASRGVSSANSARAAAESYSSGGGGFSSGGGGGGSFGGGGRNRFTLKNKGKKIN